MMAVIQIDKLQKSYGKHVGTRDVTFSVEQGEIFGFVGPNGAGKSTTLKTLMGFIAPDGGKASIDGLDVWKESKRIKTFTGYVPSDVRLYPNLRVAELLRRNAAFYPIDCAAETQRLCQLFSVDIDKRFHELSTGNKKKVSIICALMPRPRVIILDEPTNGLDPMVQKSLFEELKRQTADGATVLLSSHNLTEVQAYCQRVAFIKSGAIIAVLDLSTAQSPQKILTLEGGHASLPDAFTLLSASGSKRIVRTALGGMHLIAALQAIVPDDFTVEHESMEERFWHLYGQEEIQ